MEWILNVARAEEAAEAAAQESAFSKWFSGVFAKFAEVSYTMWIGLAALVVLGIILIMITRGKKIWTAEMIAYGALAIALSYVLSYVRLYRMPTGGSVTLASMLPIMLFSVAYGVGPGLLVGLVYGTLQYLQGGWWLNIWQFLFDYPLAFAALGLAGLAKDKDVKWMYASIPIAALGRAVCAIIAGMMWMAGSGPEDLVIGNMQFSSTFTYSAVYNGVYLVPDTAICLVLAFFTGRRIVRVMKKG